MLERPSDLCFLQSGTDVTFDHAVSAVHLGIAFLIHWQGVLVLLAMHLRACFLSDPLYPVHNQLDGLRASEDTLLKPKCHNAEGLICALLTIVSRSARCTVVQ